LGGKLYTKYNKINKNSENFWWGKIAARGLSPPALSLLRA